MTRMIKKTIELNQDHIDKIRVIFGVRTDREAVNKAMELAVIDEENIKAHERLGGQGSLIEKVFQ